MNNLKKQNSWVCWKLEEVNGRKTKVPYNAITGGRAMSNNPDTWCSYDIAKERSSNFDGMGIMFSGGICGIDIDGADEHTKMNPLQAEVMELFKGTYTELSPSGKGVHILFKCDRAKLPLQIDENGNFKRNDKGYLMLDGYKQKNDASGLECYFDGVTARYFTFTGNKISDTSTIADKTEEVLIFLDRYMKDTKKAKKPTKDAPPQKHGTARTPEASLSEALDFIRATDSRFSTLYDMGDTSAYSNDESRADLALCNYLAFYLKGDAVAIDTAFRGSALYREKWNREDYRTRTINEAIADRNGEYYSGNYKIKTTEAKADASPVWLKVKTNTDGEFKGYEIIEPEYAKDFVKKHKLCFVNGNFYNEQGLVNKGLIKQLIQTEIEPYFEKGFASRVNNLFEFICNYSYSEPPTPAINKIYCKGKTLTITENAELIEDTSDDSFTFNRLNVEYKADAPTPENWLAFLNDLLFPEDIETLQEYMGYCLIPTTIGQKALFIVGQGGEGKSRIGVVLQDILQGAMISDKLHRLEDDRFLLAKLENKLLFYDDDLNTKKMAETGTFKGLVTNEITVQAEAKGKDKFDLKTYARFLSCGNQALSSCFDRSDGFYRRLLILTCKPKNRASDDRLFVNKLLAEKESIFKWCIDGLLRLVKNEYNFTVSLRAETTLNNLQSDENNILQFMADKLYFEQDATEQDCISYRDLLDLYKIWCFNNGLEALADRTFSTYLKDNQSKFNIVYDALITIPEQVAHKTINKRVRGYKGIKLTAEALTELQYKLRYDRIKF